MSDFIGALIADAAERVRSQNQDTGNQYDADLKLIPINDNKHLGNHLNYLFRTDSAQKWTNSLTDGNVYIFVEDGGYRLSSAAGLTERQRLLQAVKESIRKRAKAAGLSMNDYAESLIMLRSDYLDGSVFHFTEKIKAATIEFIDDVFDSIEGMDLVCAVVHVDQKNNFLHVHLLIAGVDIDMY